MRALPSHPKLKLLESNPTPTLEDIVSFAQRFCTLRDLPCGQSNVNACTAATGVAPPHFVSLVDAAKDTA